MYTKYLLDATDAHQIKNTKKQSQNGIQYKAEGHGGVMITDNRQRGLVVDMNSGKPRLSGGRRAAEGRSVVDVRSIQSPGAGVTCLTVRCVRLSVRPSVCLSLVHSVDRCLVARTPAWR